MALEITLPTILAKMGINAFNENTLRTNEPNEQSTIHHANALKDAAVKRAATIAPEAAPFLVGTVPVEPTKEIGLDQLASHSTVILPDGRTASKIRINPNADSSIYAHELGHGVSQKTKAGKFINNARHVARKNPKLSKALAMALPGVLAGTGAALQEGDDDLAASIAIAAAAASPTLIDEALASKNALAIMNDAGMRATAGQRGRLAGGYLSYLAPVLLAGSVGNAFGNAADDYTAIYDL